MCSRCGQDQHYAVAPQRSVTSIQGRPRRDSTDVSRLTYMTSPTPGRALRAACRWRADTWENSPVPIKIYIYIWRRNCSPTPCTTSYLGSRVRDDNDLLPIVRALLYRDDRLADALEPVRDVFTVLDRASGHCSRELVVKLLAILRVAANSKFTDGVSRRKGDTWHTNTPCGTSSQR